MAALPDPLRYMQQLFQQAPGFVCVLDGPKHVYRLANDAYYQLIGHRNILGHELAQVLPEVVEQGFLAKLDAVFQTGERYIGRAVPIQLQREPHCPLSQHYIDLIYQPIRDPDGTVVGIFCQGHDVTETHELSQQISYQAAHDPLTGLPNRREFARLTQALIHDATPDPDACHTLLYMDLDHFKLVNDRCGHAAGDALLCQVAQSLQAVVRGSDILARLGGDEFALVLRHCTHGDAHGLAERVRREIRDLVFVWEGRRYSITISIGMITFPADDAWQFSRALSRADAACFMAKEKGRNRIQRYYDGDEELVRQQHDMDWASRLRDAMLQDRIVLFGQRIVAVHADPTAVLHKTELLARLVDSNDAYVPPSVFIPAAERYGLISQLDRHIIRKAFQMLSRLPSATRQDTRYFINLSATTLGEESFSGFVESTLAGHTDLRAHQICFELTETSAVANLSRTRAAMQRLIDQGFSFALDDFGSGMASFTYLRELPVNYVKIDGNFISRIVTDPVSAVMVESVVRVAHAMNVKTVAEFVENDAVLRKLLDLNIDFAQGYFLHRPELLGHNS